MSAESFPVCLGCGLQKYDYMCLSVGHGWLPIDQFVQCKSVLAMLYQHYLGGGILFDPPIEFGNKHS